MNENEQLKRVAEIAGIRLPTDVSVVDHHVVLNERRFHYREWGKQEMPRLLFLHGGNQTCHTWNVICAALSDRYHSVALDQRGHGDSEWSYEGDYSMEAQSEDVVALTCHLKWPSVTIIGMSMGCIVGLQYARQRGETLDGFVAVDAGPYVDFTSAAAISRFVNDNRQHQHLDDYVAAALRFNRRRDPVLLRYSLQRNLRRLIDGRWTWKTDTRVTDRMSQIRVGMNELAQHVGEIRCPVLVMRGEESDVFSDTNALRFFNELQNGTYVTIRHAGHSIQGDNPKGLLGALEPFIDNYAS